MSEVSSLINSTEKYLDRVDPEYSSEVRTLLSTREQLQLDLQIATIKAELAKAAAFEMLSDAIRESNLHVMEVSFKDTLTVKGTGVAKQAIVVSER